MIRKKNIIVVSAVVVLLFVVTRGVFMKIQYRSYKGQYFSFHYPKDWTLRESEGAAEKYFQVHLFGKINQEVGFGPSVTVTVYPKKESGGKFETWQEFAKVYAANMQKLKGCKLESEKMVTLTCQALAKDIELSFFLRLPLYKTSAKDVLIKEKTLIFEKGANLYVVSYKNLSTDYVPYEPIFKRLIGSFKLV